MVKSFVLLLIIRTETEKENTVRVCMSVGCLSLAFKLNDFSNHCDEALGIYFELMLLSFSTRQFQKQNRTMNFNREGKIMRSKDFAGG